MPQRAGVVLSGGKSPAKLTLPPLTFLTPQRKRCVVGKDSGGKGSSYHRLCAEPCGRHFSCSFNPYSAPVIGISPPLHTRDLARGGELSSVPQRGSRGAGVYLADATGDPRLVLTRTRCSTGVKSRVLPSATAPGSQHFYSPGLCCMVFPVINPFWNRGGVYARARSLIH